MMIMIILYNIIYLKIINNKIKKKKLIFFKEIKY